MNRTMILWSLLKVMCVFTQLALLLLLFLSFFSWTDFVWAFFDSKFGRLAIGIFHILLGISFYKTACLHPYSSAFEVTGILFTIVGALITVWGTTAYYMPRLDIVLFSTNGGQILLFLMTIGPLFVGSCLKQNELS